MNVFFVLSHVASLFSFLFFLSDMKLFANKSKMPLVLQLCSFFFPRTQVSSFVVCLFVFCRC